MGPAAAKVVLAVSALTFVVVVGSALSRGLGLHHGRGLSFAAMLTAHGRMLAGATTRAEGVARCSTIPCLREAHELPAGGGRFNFPHAMIIGFPKCATTSLYSFLKAHPEAIASDPKEPSFYTRCRNDTDRPFTPGVQAWPCEHSEQHYLDKIMKRSEAVASGLSKMAFEGSTRYSTGDLSATAAEVAVSLRKEMPWLKLVISLREPIGWVISGRVHSASFVAMPPAQRPTWFKMTPELFCLEGVNKGTRTMFDCLVGSLDKKPSYRQLLAWWLDDAGWPKEQFYIMQYENFTTPENSGPALRDLQLYLGLNPNVSAPLPKMNTRREKFHPEGWPMKRYEYENLLATLRPQCESLAAFLEERGYWKAPEWLARWEAVWNSTLAACDAKGDCRIRLS
ncbi:hypothetical protein Rsub_11546 [Raphidocelis subcapitata]|uniref:Sulfotransferase n=1 Tax=Raphidocelis subcapitata TaxID=307507 RepID=A0A2V0PGC4_9CHLO|nr:hypothetical protein Rsub_11546 [Raphidocelis subcapitata]|eukprot:GBF98908.1 hypothetical protein Rsub_11546 [Raphidocelis subcapitata]